jgi:hypothetical protein
VNIFSENPDNYFESTFLITTGGIVHGASSMGFCLPLLSLRTSS